MEVYIKIRNEPALDNNDATVLLLMIIALIHSNSKKYVTFQTSDNGTKDVKIIVLSQYLRNVWKTCKMPACNLVLT